MTGSRYGPGLALGLALVFAAGCDRGPKAGSTETPRLAAPRTAYAQELASLDAAIDSGRTLGAQRGNDTLLNVEVVGLYQERARLTGNYSDFTLAQALLDAQPVAPQPSASVCLARARLHYTLHRLRQAGAALDTCPTTAEPTEIGALRGDIAMYSGRYHEAERIYRALVNQSGLPAHYIRLGLLKAKTGSPGEAQAFLEAAEKRYYGVSATMKAWMRLQRGLVALDRGRFDEALALYRLASDALPGWWLVDEHIAEVTRMRGDAEGARSLYADIVKRTQAPEFMDALAGLERDAGHAEEAKRLTAQARAIYEKRMAEHPEAAAGHALDHFLQDSSDAARALELAQANFRTRPYGDAAMGLAKAWMLSGKPERAVPLVETQLASGWDTAEAYWILAQALGRSGRAEAAARARAEALRRNPECERMYILPA